MKTTRKPRSKQAGRVRGTRVQLNGQAEAHVNGNGQAAAPGEFFCSTTARKLKKHKLTYLWNGRLALKQITLLVGDTSMGKSLMLARVAAQLTTGEALPGGPRVQPCKVAILTVERHASLWWQPRLAKAGADMDRVEFLGWDGDGNMGKRLQMPSHKEQLAEWLKKKTIQLLIIDPVGSALDNGMDENHGTVARPVVEAYARAAGVAGCAVALVKHPNKRVGGSTLDRISGSKEWVNAPDFVLAIGRNPHDPEGRVLVVLKPSGRAAASSLRGLSDEEEDKPLWTWEGETPLTADEVFAGETDPVERSAGAECKAFIIARLDAEAVRQTEFVAELKANGHKEGTWKRVKLQLGVQSVHIANGDPPYWEWRKPAAWPAEPSKSKGRTVARKG